MEEKPQKQEQVNLAKPIPSISLADGKVVVETKDVPLIVNKKESIVKMRKVTAGERRDLVKKSSSIKVVGNQPSGTVDMVEYQIGMLVAVIIEAPFELTRKSIEDLPSEIVEYLYDEYSEFADLKKKD